MTTQTADVMIYTPNAIESQVFTALEEKMKTLDGIVEFKRHPHIPTLIQVVYQTQRVRALAILNKMTRSGFNASLVGM